MDLDMQTSPQDSVDVRVAFRKPSNDAANRKYRRRSPVGGSSSSDESPNRGHSNSPVPSRNDIAKVSDDCRAKNDGKNFSRDSGRSQYGPSGDRHRRSDQHSSKTSYHRYDDYVRSEKYADDNERDHMKSTSHSRREKYADDSERDHIKSTSQSGREPKDVTHHDYFKKEAEHNRSRDHVHDVDHYNRTESDEPELRSRDKEREKSFVDNKIYKDKDSSSGRAGSSRRHTDHNTEDIRSRGRDQHKGDGNGHDGNRAYYKGNRDSRNEKRDYYKGDRNGRDGRGDYYKGDRDGRDDKSEYYRGVRDGPDEKRDYYKGDGDGRDEKRDYYKGNRDGRDEKREYYKGHRDGGDEKRSQRSLGVHRSHHSPSYEEMKGHQNDLVSRRDGSVHHLREASRNDAKELDNKKYAKEEKKKYDDQETNQLKEEYSRDSGLQFKDKYVSSSKGQESPAKKPKLFGMDGSSDCVEEVSKFATISGANTSVTLNQAQETAGKVTSEQTLVKDSDIDAAKVAAMRAAELVNRNLIGTGYLSTDQKKKLLWGNKKSSVAEESAHHWDTAMFSDRERQEKFNKLMSLRLHWYLWPIVGCEGRFEGGPETQQPRCKWSYSIREAEGTPAGFREAIYSWTPSKRWPHSWIRSLRNNLVLILCLYDDILQHSVLPHKRHFAPCLSLWYVTSVIYYLELRGSCLLQLMDTFSFRDHMV